MANYQHGYCYGILDENGQFVYVGSSLSLSPEKRFARHHTHANISLDSPLHRMMAGALHRMRWQLIVLEAMEPGTSREQLRNREQVHISQLRAAGHPLCNRNNAVCQSERTRLRQQAWRAAHPGYMAEAGRRYRARQKALRAQARAQQDSPVEAEPPADEAVPASAP